MKKYFKRIFLFIGLLLLYIVPSLIIKFDLSFYKSIKGAFIAPYIFIIGWSAIYILVALNITLHFIKFEEYNGKDLRRYLIYTIINYIFNVMFLITFSIFNSLSISYLMTLFTALSAFFMFLESLLLRKKYTLLLIPYIIWTSLATIYIIMLYVSN